MVPIFVITGAPGAGKTTLCATLATRFPFGIHIPIDDLREWVVSGLSSPLDWCDETERQFRLAERAALEIAKRYQEAGFCVAVDNCRDYASWQSAIDEILVGCPTIKVALLPDLATNLARNRSRSNKTFDPTVLDGLIEELNPRFISRLPKDWASFDTGVLSTDEIADILLRDLH